jgi:hypothetical protein
MRNGPSTPRAGAPCKSPDEDHQCREVYQFLTAPDCRRTSLYLFEACSLPSSLAVIRRSRHLPGRQQRCHRRVNSVVVCWATTCCHRLSSVAADFLGYFCLGLLLIPDPTFSAIGSGPSTLTAAMARTHVSRNCRRRRRHAQWTYQRFTLLRISGPRWPNECHSSREAIWATPRLQSPSIIILVNQISSQLSLHFL